MSEFSDSEKFLRYLLLLGEGGSLVLRGVVLREVAKRRQILDVILSNSRELLSSKITNAHGYRRIYPNTSSVNADISTWDINLLAMVIIHLFGNTLEQVQLNWITEIQSTRESITAGDTKHVTLEEEEYRKNRLRLSLNLLNLAAETDFNTHYFCLDVISKSGVVPYDVQTLLQKVSEIHEYPSDMIHNLQKQLEEETEVDERTGHNLSYIRGNIMYTICEIYPVTIRIFNPITRCRIFFRDMRQLNTWSWYTAVDHVIFEYLSLLRKLSVSPAAHAI